MLSLWLRWGSALIPIVTSLTTTTYLLYTQNWQQWGIEGMPLMTPSPTSFADLANITATSDCIAQGAPLADCDPYGRPFQPYVVLPARVLALMGLGLPDTGALGALLAMSYVATVALLAGVIAGKWRSGLPGLYLIQAMLALGAVSPGPILGMERGQIEQPVMLLVVVSLILLPRSGTASWLGAVASFLATAIKYLTVGMFLAFFNRQTIVRRNWAVIFGGVASLGFLVLSIPQLRQAAATSDSGTPQTTMSAFGLTNSVATPLSGSPLYYYPPDDVAAAWPLLRVVGIVIFAVVVVALIPLVRRITLPATESLAWTLTVGSGGVLLLPYLIGSSHDYRLIFLLPLMTGLALWWNEVGSTASGKIALAAVGLSTVALATSAAMLPAAFGLMWPTWVIILGDLSLLLVLSLIAALAISRMLEPSRAESVR